MPGYVALKTVKGAISYDLIEDFKKEFSVLKYERIIIVLCLFCNRMCNSPYLIKFYGAALDETIPDAQVLSIVLQYCEKGSLYLCSFPFKSIV